jgi:TRAP-type C4-dicarboxylate transport system permease small subunit
MNHLVNLLDQFLRLITRKVGLVAGWTLITLSIVITLNVLTRKLLNYSLQGVDEYGGYCLAICASIGFSQAAYEKAHIRISIVTDQLPLRWRALFDIAALLVLTSVAYTLAGNALDVTETSYRMQALATSALRTPLAIPQAAWSAALIWFSLVLSIQCLRAFLKWIQKDYVGITRDYGVTSVEEEIEEEMRAARTRMSKGSDGDKQ